MVKIRFWTNELNSRDAMGCLGGSDQASQPDALGISLMSRPKRYEVVSLRVDMGNPGSMGWEWWVPWFVNKEREVLRWQ